MTLAPLSKLRTPTIVAVMHPSFRPAAFTAALLLLPALSPAQTLVGRNDSVYTWRGAIPASALLTIRNFNGPIDVRPAAGTTAEVRAEKRTSRGSGAIEDVAFEIQKGSGGDVTICATLRNNNPCDDSRYNNHDDDRDGWRRNVTVAMTVLLPKGAQLRVATGNGAVTVERVGGDVQASTGNGRVRVDGTEGSVKVSTGNGDVDVNGAKSSVRVSTGNGRVNITTADGPVEARTGNGDIDVSMTQLRSREDMTFSTGSGRVRVTLPAGYNGELDASTGNGELRSDFDLKIQGRMNPRHVRATIGEGGPKLRLATGNGRLEVLKR
jgi:hypothetical protein